MIDLDNYLAQQVVDAVVRRLVEDGLLENYSNKAPFVYDFEDARTKAKRKELEIIVEEVFQAIRSETEVVELGSTPHAMVSAAGTARIIYNPSLDAVQISKNGGAYHDWVGVPAAPQADAIERLLAIMTGAAKLEDVSLELLERAVELVGLAAVAKAKKEKDAT